MNRNAKQNFIRAAALLAIFIGFTVLVATLDVRPIAPDQSGVGLSSINQFVFEKIGTHPLWYTVTEFIGIAALLCAASFAAAGLYQMITRKGICAVDRRLPVLGAFYVLLAGAYLFFEQVVVNVRPILLDGAAEASYPSSHTMLVVCISATTVMQLRAFFPQKTKLCRSAEVIAAALSALTALGRLLAGVHWLSDIVGALLLSAAMIFLYRAMIALVEKERT